MVLAFLATFFFLLLYFLLFNEFRNIWKRYIPGSNTGIDSNPSFSIVVPFFNEEKNLANLLQSIKDIDFPAEKFEFILVNDYSNDNSLSIIKEYGFHANVVKSDLPKGKKHALLCGFNNAKFEWVLITDADCILPSGILKALSSHISENDSVLISGPVFMKSNENSFFQRFQSLEFMALNGTGGASVISGQPFMCSSANLTMKRHLFPEAFNNIHPEINSGDDIFLLEYVKEKYSGKLTFLKQQDAIVATIPQKTILTFFRQRARWISKTPFYKNTDAKRVALLIAIMNIWFFILCILTFFNLKFLFIFLIYLSCKSLVDYRFLSDLSDFYRNRGAMKYFAVSQLAYPFYILITLKTGFFYYLRISKGKK